MEGIIIESDVQKDTRRGLSATHHQLTGTFRFMQIIRLSSFEPCSAPAANPQLAALHRVMAPISNNPAPTPISFGPILPPLPAALPFFPPTYEVRPNPIPLPLPIIAPQPILLPSHSGPKRTPSFIQSAAAVITMSTSPSVPHTLLPLPLPSARRRTPLTPQKRTVRAMAEREAESARSVGGRTASVPCTTPPITSPKQDPS